MPGDALAWLREYYAVSVNFSIIHIMLHAIIDKMQ